MPLVSPPTVAFVGPAVVTNMPPGLAVTVYCVMDVPFGTDAPQLTVADWLPRVAVGVPGAPGTAAKTTAFDAAEVAPGPTPFCATTVNV